MTVLRPSKRINIEDSYYVIFRERNSKDYKIAKYHANERCVGGMPSSMYDYGNNVLGLSKEEATTVKKALESQKYRTIIVKGVENVDSLVMLSLAEPYIKSRSLESKLKKK